MVEDVLQMSGAISPNVTEVDWTIHETPRVTQSQASSGASIVMLSSCSADQRQAVTDSMGVRMSPAPAAEAQAREGLLI